MAHIEANARITAQVISNYLRKRVEPIFRKSVWMGMFRSRGKISYNNHGKDLDWRPRVRRRTITAGDGNPSYLSFPGTSTRVQAVLPWRTYHLGESVTKFEKLTSQNSDTALFKIAEGLLNEMVDDFVEDFRIKMYVDGNATATNKDIHGIESFMSVSSTVTNSVAGNPNDTYAGISTALGTFDDDWTAATGNGWPTGTGDTGYSAWSPLVVDYTNAGSSPTGWLATTKTWPNTWQEAIRFCLTYLDVLQSGRPDVLILNAELLRQAEDSLEDKERLQVSARPELRDLGIRALAFEGVDIVTEYGVPQNVGYFIDFDAVELKSMQPQLVATATDNDITTAQDLKSVDFFGNLCFWAPPSFAKLQAIS